MRKSIYMIANDVNVIAAYRIILTILIAVLGFFGARIVAGQDTIGKDVTAISIKLDRAQLDIRDTTGRIGNLETRVNNLDTRTTVVETELMRH